MLQFSNLKDITGGIMLMFSSDKPVTHLITDSRKAIVQEGSVFFAINGEHHDGHRYIQSLYESGIRQFVVENEISTNKYTDAIF